MSLPNILSGFRDITIDERYAFEGHHYFLYSSKARDEPVCLAWQRVVDGTKTSRWPLEKNRPELLLPEEEYRLSLVPHEQPSQFYPLLPHVAVESQYLLRNAWSKELTEPGGRQLHFASCGHRIDGGSFFAFYHCSSVAFQRLLNYATDTCDLEVSWLTLTKPWASVEESMEVLNDTLYLISKQIGAAETAGACS